MNYNDDFLGYTEPPILDPDEIGTTNSDDADFVFGLIDNEEESIEQTPDIDTTNAAETPVVIHEETDYGGPQQEFWIRGSGFLSETTSILTRKRHDIHGSKSEKHFVQRLCSTTSQTSLPLIYPESTMYPSSFWCDAKDRYSIAGALPSVLLSGHCKEDGFSDLPKHVRCRITSPLSPTSTDPRYLIFCHDLLCSVAANHHDLRRHGKGMTASDDAIGSLDLRSRDDSEFLYSIDSRQIVKNLCESQEYYPWDIFLTFTCNMRKHFGTRVIKE